MIPVSVCDRDGTIVDVTGSRVSGPNLSEATISFEEIRFTAPEVDGLGVLILEAVVTDNEGATASAQVIVRVVDVPPVPNEPPVIDLGANRIVTEGEEVQIPVVAIDPDGNVVDISGSQTEGPGIIDGTISFQFLSFVAPQVEGDQSF